MGSAGLSTAAATLEVAASGSLAGRKRSTGVAGGEALSAGWESGSAASLATGTPACGGNGKTGEVSAVADTAPCRRRPASGVSLRPHCVGATVGIDTTSAAGARVGKSSVGCWAWPRSAAPTVAAIGAAIFGCADAIGVWWVVGAAVTARAGKSGMSTGAPGTGEAERIVAPLSPLASAAESIPSWLGDETPSFSRMQEGFSRSAFDPLVAGSVLDDSLSGSGGSSP